MGGAAGMAMVLAGVLLAPPTPTVDPTTFTPGVGYTVSHLLWQLHAPPPVVETPTIHLAPHLSPPPGTDLARIQGSPRARGLHAAAAFAAEVAMIVAGVVSVREQNQQVRREREGRAPPYKPYR
ncbi:MAG: hypothetical protein KC501_19285 [Myxococcales bacterium]|nr:hypothetical protein [Myxococcales bacterium]